MTDMSTTNHTRHSAPVIEEISSFPQCYNDPSSAEDLMRAFEETLGDDAVIETPGTSPVSRSRTLPPTRYSSWPGACVGSHTACRSPVGRAVAVSVSIGALGAKPAAYWLRKPFGPSSAASISPVSKM